MDDLSANFCQRLTGMSADSKRFIENGRKVFEAVKAAETEEMAIVCFNRAVKEIPKTQHLDKVVHFNFGSVIEGETLINWVVSKQYRKLLEILLNQYLCRVYTDPCKYRREIQYEINQLYDSSPLIAYDRRYQEFHAMAQRIDELNEVDMAKLAKAVSTLDIHNSEDSTPLHIAIRLGDEQLVNQLVEYGFCLTRPDKSGTTPFLMTAITAQKSMAQRLLAYIVEDKRECLLNSGDVINYTFLHWAICLGHVEYVRWLCELNVKHNIQHTGNGFTCLFSAVAMCNKRNPAVSEPILDEVLKLATDEDLEIRVSNGENIVEFAARLHESAPAGWAKVSEKFREYCLKNYEILVQDYPGLPQVAPPSRADDPVDTPLPVNITDTLFELLESPSFIKSQKLNFKHLCELLDAGSRSPADTLRLKEFVMKHSQKLDEKTYIAFIKALISDFLADRGKKFKNRQAFLEDFRSLVYVEDNRSKIWHSLIQKHITDYFSAVQEGSREAIDYCHRFLKEVSATHVDNLLYLIESIVNQRMGLNELNQLIILFRTKKGYNILVTILNRYERGIKHKNCNLRKKNQAAFDRLLELSSYVLEQSSSSPSLLMQLFNMPDANGKRFLHYAPKYSSAVYPLIGKLLTLVQQLSVDMVSIFECRYDTECAETSVMHGLVTHIDQKLKRISNDITQFDSQIVPILNLYRPFTLDIYSNEVIAFCLRAVTTCSTKHESYECYLEQLDYYIKHKQLTADDLLLDDKPLYWHAIYLGKRKLIKWCKDHGAKLYAPAKSRYLIQDAIEANHDNVVMYCIRDEGFITLKQSIQQKVIDWFFSLIHRPKQDVIERVHAALKTMDLSVKAQLMLRLIELSQLKPAVEVLSLLTDDEKARLQVTQESTKESDGYQIIEKIIESPVNKSKKTKKYKHPAGSELIEGLCKTQCLPDCLESLIRSCKRKDLFYLCRPECPTVEDVVEEVVTVTPDAPVVDLEDESDAPDAPVVDLEDESDAPDAPVVDLEDESDAPVAPIAEPQGVPDSVREQVNVEEEISGAAQVGACDSQPSQDTALLDTTQDVVVPPESVLPVRDVSSDAAAHKSVRPPVLLARLDPALKLRPAQTQVASSSQQRVLGDLIPRMPTVFGLRKPQDKRRSKHAQYSRAPDGPWR